MKPSKLYEALHALICERVPLHIWGDCGVGKSQIVSQVVTISKDWSILPPTCLVVANVTNGPL